MKYLKTRLVSVIVLLAVLMSGNANADNISLSTAKQIGAFYYNVATGTKAPVSAEKLELVQQFDNPTLSIPALYAFNVADNGFVVVSASDCTEPVLAYSPDGRIDSAYTNPACRYMLKSYQRLICANQNCNATPTAEVKQMWNELLDQTFTCDPSSKGILVKAKWGQGDPYHPSYNTMCPQIQGRPCLTGCVATAMSMIIHYWKYPLKGGSQSNPTAMTSWNNQTIKYKFLVDSNKFIYDSMPDQISHTSPWNNRRAVGKLCFACGVTVKMDWGLDASGAVSQNVPEAFSKWFNYSNNAKHIYRAYYNDNQWLDILHSELDDNARPVYYSACDPDPEHGKDARHAFVIAGTTSSNRSMFYIRWGWDRSSDGYFSLAPSSSIGYAGGYYFTDEHAMVYQIYPASNDPVGIEENTSFTQNAAYPNPATDHIMIPSDLSFNAILSVYNIDGKLVKTAVIPNGTKEYRLDLQGFTPGTYIYRLNGSAVKFNVL